MSMNTPRMAEAAPSEKISKAISVAGGAAAAIFILYAIAAILVMVFIKEGYPTTALECFSMLQENRTIGLLRLDILTVAVMPLYYILFFAIYAAMNRESELIGRIALFCVLAGVTVFLSGMNISSILLLNDKYHAATEVVQKEHLLAAAEALLAMDMWVNTGAIFRGLLIETGALLFSVQMLWHPRFGKRIAWTGIVTHGLDLLHEVTGIFTDSLETVFISLAGPLYIIWFCLMMIVLLKKKAR